MEIKKRLSSILESPSNDIDEKLLKICQLLDQEYSYFNWTGFYFRNGDKEELV
jgi:GAF domain-containing protein